MIATALNLGAALGIGAFAISLCGLGIALLNSRRGAKQTFVDQLEERIKLCEEDRSRLSEHVTRLGLEVERLGAREIELMKLLTKTV